MFEKILKTFSMEKFRKQLSFAKALSLDHFVLNLALELTKCIFNLKIEITKAVLKSCFPTPVTDALGKRAIITA